MKQLLISPRILKILAILLQSNQPLYVREIARKSNFPPATVSRILQHLVQQELVNFQIKGNVKLFRLNQNHPSFPEIKSLAQKEAGQIPLLTQVLKQVPLITSAVIYGSAAKNDLSSTSDVDLIIVGSPPVDQLNQTLNQLEKTLGREINYSLYSPEEFFVERKKNGFLKHILNQKTIILINRPLYEPEKKVKTDYI